MPGDTLITSGTDSVYPKGLVVGTVTEVSRDSDSSGRYVLAMPTVDFQHIEEVLILRTVVETGEDLSPVPSPTPRPLVTPEVQPTDLAGVTEEEPEDNDYFVWPSAAPESGTTPVPVYEDLPEDTWAGT